MSLVCSKYNDSSLNWDSIYEDENLFSYESSSTEESRPPNPQLVQNNMGNEANTQCKALVYRGEDDGESTDTRDQDNISNEDSESEETPSCSPSTYPGWCTDIYGERTILSDREKEGVNLASSTTRRSKSDEIFTGETNELLAFLTLATPKNPKFSYESSSAEDSKHSSPKSEQDDMNDIALYDFSSTEEKEQRCSHLQEDNIDNGVSEHKTSVSPEKISDQLAENEGESNTKLIQEDKARRQLYSVIRKQAESIDTRAKSESYTFEMLSTESSTSSSIALNPNPRSGKCAVQETVGERLNGRISSNDLAADQEKSERQWNGPMSFNDSTADQETSGRQWKEPISSNNLSMDQEKSGSQPNRPMSSNDLSADQEKCERKWKGTLSSNDMSADQGKLRRPWNGTLSPNESSADQKIRNEEIETSRITQQVKDVLHSVYNSKKPGNTNLPASPREVTHGRQQTSVSSIHTLYSLDKCEVKTTDSRVSPLKQVKSLDNKSVKTGRMDVKEQYSPDGTYGSMGWASLQQEQHSSLRTPSRRKYPRTSASRNTSARATCRSTRPVAIMDSNGELSPYVPLISKSSLRNSEQKRNLDRSERGRKTILPMWDENWNHTALKLVGSHDDGRYTKPRKPRGRLGPRSEKRQRHVETFVTHGTGWLDIAISLGVVTCWPVWLEFKGKKMEMEKKNGLFCSAFIVSSLAVLIAINGRCFSEFSEMVILLVSSLLYLLYSVIRLYSSLFLGGSWEGVAAAAGYYFTFLLLIAKPWRALRSFRNRLKPLQYNRY